MKFVDALTEVSSVVIGHVGGESSRCFHNRVAERNNLFSALDGAGVLGNGRRTGIENHRDVEVVDRQHVRLVGRHHPDG